MRVKITQLIIGCLVVLSTLQVQAQGVWEQPRNTLNLPVAGATAVEIYLPQRELYVESGVTNPMMGGATTAIAMTLERRDHAATERIRASMPGLDLDKLLREAFSRHMGPRQIANISKVTVHHGEPADIEAAAPGNPDEQVLALRVRYHFTAGLPSLQVAMSARLGPRNVVTSAPKRVPSPVFSQELVYHVPGGRLVFSHPSTRYQVWYDMGGNVIADEITVGVDSIMAMLASELGTRPRFGRVPGKQIAWLATYGVVEQSHGARDWVRMRNGLLVSLPTR